MSYQHITLKERYVIYHLRLMRLSFREIGRRLNRHHTSEPWERTMCTMGSGLESKLFSDKRGRQRDSERNPQ